MNRSNELFSQTLSFDKCDNVLKSNAKESVTFTRMGQDLIKQSEQAMTDTLAEEIRDYITRCNSQIKVMHELRRPYTDILLDLQKRFVAIENRIDPKKAGTPAYQCGQILDLFLREKLEREAKERVKLERNHKQTLRRIQARADMSEEERHAAIARAESRMIASQRNLELHATDYELIPEVIEPQGYVELFKFWWENVGKGLPDTQLCKIFHPMLMFAIQQARKNILVKCSSLNYNPTPKRNS